MHEHEFLRHFVSHEKALKAFLLAVTNDIHAAEDLSQDIAIIAWKKFSQYDPSQSFGAWLFAIARFELLHWRRSKANQRIILSEEAISMLAQEQNNYLASRNDEERIRMVEKCMKQLTQYQQTVMRLRYKKGCSIREISENLGKSLGSILMVLQRARAILRECVERQSTQSDKQI